jgi:hypothetical protein
VATTRRVGPLAGTGAAAVLYTVPQGKRALLAFTHACNTTAGSGSYTLSIGADAAGTRLFSGKVVATTEYGDWAGNIPLLAGETVQWTAPAGITIVLTVIETP